jgi:hypothetical protein
MGNSTIDTHRAQREVDFRVFGPAILIRDGRPVDLPTGGPRELLALLLLDPRRTVNAAQLDKATGPSDTPSAVFAHAARTLEDALADSGVDLTYPPRSGSVVLTGAPDVDLDRCGSFIARAFVAEDVTAETELLRSAIRELDGDPLPGLSGAFFDELRSDLIAAKAILHHLAAEPVRALAERWDDAAPAHRFNPVIHHWASIAGHTSARELETMAHLKVTRLPEPVATDLEVSVYLGDGQDARSVEDALIGLLDEVGFNALAFEPPVIGSWFRKFTARAGRYTDHLSVHQAAAELERKLRIEVFDKQQAAIDNQQATGAAALIAALQGEDRACIRVGSLLVIKVDGLVMVDNLTQYQLAWLERNLTLLRDPEGLLKGLESLPSREAAPGVQGSSETGRGAVEATPGQQ